MKTLLPIALLWMLACCPADAQTFADDSTIRAILDAQIVEWNKGNMAGYMKGYWPSDSLVFIGKSGPTYGFAATLTRYLKAYPDAAHMGTLTSKVLKLRMLSPEWAYATGSWALKRTTDDLNGYWTLLWRKIGGVWFIVEDHSS